MSQQPLRQSSHSSPQEPFQSVYASTSTNLTGVVGSSLSITNSHLQIQDPSSSNGSLLIGSGRANSLSPMLGFQFEYRAFRMSVEYVFEYVFYTGASLDDQKKSPNAPLQSALAYSLRNDRNGVRFEVGFAF